MAGPRDVKGVLEAGAAYLEARGIGEARLLCELLAARLLRCRRLELYLRFDTVLTEAQLGAMRRGVKRVGDGEPVQYVTGQTGFMGHVLACDPRALIPRPETEVAVRAALEADGVPDEALVLDIGTGSGCIAVSLVAARPGWRCIGLDRSHAALALAAENVGALGLGDRVVLTGADLSDCVAPESVDLVAANLPYVPTAAWEALPPSIRDHEPRVALDGGADGLDVIREVVPDAAIVLRPGAWLVLEIGEEQGEAVTGLLDKEGFTGIRVLPDLAGRDRVVRARARAV